jgi:cytosine/adenosine deaminase-related metal-dependent hydrolase
MSESSKPSKDREVILSGTIIYGDDFEPLEGYLCIKDGIIAEVGRGKVEADFEGIICPRFVNAHTHIGDSAFKDPPFLSLEELVGPYGLKHRMLAQTSRERLLEGMKRSLRDMLATGTFAFADFREGGPEGVEIMQEALQGMPRNVSYGVSHNMPLISRIMGRPIPGCTETHGDCWGLGISSTRDCDFRIQEECVSAARKKGQKVAIHAGESGRDDISSAISLEPDFLVHLNRASDEDLKEIADHGIPVVICPRSNLVTGTGLPDVQRMIDLGITVGVGTDNVMLNSPNMFEEMGLICRALLKGDRQVFKMCTLNGAEIMGIDRSAGSICEGKMGRVMVIDALSDNMWGSSDLRASVVRRARPSDIKAVF